MIQGDIHASRVIKNKGEQFQQEVADRLLEVRQGFTSQDVQSCRMSVHGEDITLSPAARQVLPITVECKAQKKIPPTQNENRRAVRQRNCVYQSNLSQWPTSRSMVKCH